MYLNTFAQGTEPLDMTTTDEFRSLLASAGDLGIPHLSDVPYASRNIVLCQQRFHFLEWGRSDAPAIVLLHGGHQSAHSWDLVSLHLAQRYRVFALDQRGHGDSEWARDVEYTNTTMSEDAEAFIRALGIAEPLLIGHSMGGRNALLLARRSPALLRALVIVDIAPEVSDEGRKMIGGFVRMNQEFDDLEHFIGNVRKYDPYRPREHIERTVKYNMLRRADGKFVSKCDSTPCRLGLLPAAAADHVSLDDLRLFSMPTLMVRGENSNVVTQEAAEHCRDALPRGRLAVVPNCGHNVHGQNTPGFLSALNCFLESME